MKKSNATERALWMLPISRPEDVKAREEPNDGWVPGWNPLLDIWKTMSNISRNQVRLAQSQLLAMRLWMALSLMWMLTTALWTWALFYRG